MADTDKPEADAEEIPHPKERRFGCSGGGCGSIGCFSVIVALLAYAVMSTYLSTPQTFGDKKLVVKEIHRFHQKFGRWPTNLSELKTKLPDYKFKYRYAYSHNEKMFVVSYQGAGMASDEGGSFYRSDSGEWKDINSNRKEFLELEERLRTGN